MMNLVLISLLVIRQNQQDTSHQAT